MKSCNFGTTCCIEQFCWITRFIFFNAFYSFYLLLLGVILLLIWSPLICLEMLEISASKLVLLRIEFCPRSIYELVQSRKGFISDNSSSVDFKYELLGVRMDLLNTKNLSNNFWSFDSCLILIPDNDSFNFLRISWLCLFN